MKLSEFKGGRKIVVKLGDGTEFGATYNPRFFVGENIDYFNEFIGDGTGKTGSELCDTAYHYIVGLITRLDITDDDGKDIPVTVDTLQNVFCMDLSTMRQIHQAAFEDMTARANPTSPTGDVFSSGSTQTES